MINWTPMDYSAYFTHDPKICGGETVIRGTRVTLKTVLASLAEGARTEEITADFPTLTEDAVRAVVAFAAATAEKVLPTPPLPSLR